MIPDSLQTAALNILGHKVKAQIHAQVEAGFTGQDVKTESEKLGTLAEWCQRL